MKKLLVILSLSLLLGCALPDFGFKIIEEEEYDIKIEWLGHAGFLVESPRAKVYINPYSPPVGSLKGDSILVSSSSSDLCDLSAINNLRKDDTIIITPPECLARLAVSNAINLEIGESYTVKDVLIETVDAYLINGTIDKGQGAGFVITINQTRIYYTGITDVIPEMNGVSGIDVLIFPIAGSDLSMSMLEAVSLIRTMNASYNIPMYYGGNTGTSLDAGREMKSLAKSNGYNVTLLNNQDLLIG